MTDLWPETFVDENRPKAPVAVLREQASLLGDKTNNIVVAEVKPSRRRSKAQHTPPTPDEIEPDEEFRYAFYLVAPALDNYSYRLFTIGNNIDLYPVTLYWSEGDTQVTLAYNQPEFEAMLRQIFRSPRTQTLINAMLAQSEEREEPDIPF